MSLRNSADGYGAIARSLHWLTVVLVAIAWALGTFDDVLPKGAARAAGLFVHISAGVAILRAWRRACSGAWPTRHPGPRPRCSERGWIPRPGLRITRSRAAGSGADRGHRAPVRARRGVAPVRARPRFRHPGSADRAYARSVKEVHEVLANALVMLAAFHAAAALVHHWVFRDRTLVRMLPDAPALAAMAWLPHTLPRPSGRDQGEPAGDEFAVDHDRPRFRPALSPASAFCSLHSAGPCVSAGDFGGADRSRRASVGRGCLSRAGNQACEGDRPRDERGGARPVAALEEWRSADTFSAMKPKVGGCWPNWPAKCASWISRT